MNRDAFENAVCENVKEGYRQHFFGKRGSTLFYLFVYCFKLLNTMQITQQNLLASYKRKCLQYEIGLVASTG